MSDGGVPHFSIVCEGPTDFHVIDAVLRELTPMDYTRTMIQPESAEFAGEAVAETGRGWKGAIIHVDADIATDSEVDCARPCPPASDTTDRVRDIVLGWAEPR